ncbi:uncharacterized protein BJ171DRAFT_31494 [Polychytrium aggregatum]|uniref:uncharacterized protein n=1 Tax=Polychytrium aggregatum TaxID=110093 RepID=UPI0022FF2653|nr:uncharacterized protein BJ171DRAFT_31494 [Polychytrium aggregatum]KAI9206490.1 hypothetical protein BJ171DRAFT_31494 [Polychytrium aggregatum]
MGNTSSTRQQHALDGLCESPVHPSWYPEGSVSGHSSSHSLCSVPPAPISQSFASEVLVYIHGRMESMAQYEKGLPHFRGQPRPMLDSPEPSSYYPPTHRIARPRPAASPEDPADPLGIVPCSASTASGNDECAGPSSDPMCSICCDSMPLHKEFRIPSCGHSFCRTCAHSVVTAELFARRLPIVCPICKAEKVVPTVKVRATRSSDPVYSHGSSVASFSDAAPAPLGATRRNYSLSDVFHIPNRSEVPKRLWKSHSFMIHRLSKSDTLEIATDIAEPRIGVITEDVAAQILTVSEKIQMRRITIQVEVLDKSNAHSGLVLCPNTSCFGVFSIDPSLTQAKCPFCETSWCVSCKADTSHEGLSCQEYTKMREESRSADGTVNSALLRDEFKFETLVRQMQWTRCPNCTRVCEKDGGCNKIVCEMCNTIFCYICGKKLHPKKPYSHYAKRWKKCYGKLFFGDPTE